MKPVIAITGVRGDEMGYSEVTGHDFYYLMQTYSDMVYRFGGTPLIIPPAEEMASDDDLLNSLLSKADGLYFTGGGMRIGSPVPPKPLYEQQPIRAAWEDKLIKEAYARDIPSLGVCRGHQMMAVALGGKMNEKRFPEHKQKAPYDMGAHEIKIERKSKLYNIIGADTWLTNTIHIEEVQSVPEGFIISARSDDGVCEAIEATEKKFFMGTQFHPELMPDHPYSALIFKAFISACSEK